MFAADQRRTQNQERLPIIIGVVGPAGTGKSTLARKIARMITRSEHSPNVLLIDADIFGRGLTSLIDGVGEIECKHLHDVIAGDYAAVSPVELPESCIGPGEWPSLPEDGRVFFVPASRTGAERIEGAESITDLSGLRGRLFDAISSAAHSGRAEAIVIDTAPTPEPTGALLASMCDLIILIGDKDHGEDVIREHLDSLKEILGRNGARLEGIPVEIVFNQMSSEAPQARSPVECHVIPALGGLRDRGNEIAEMVDLERRVSAIVSPFFSRAHPGLLPSWCAPLPGEWRKVAMSLGESTAADGRSLGLANRIVPPFLKRAALALAIALPALTCLLLASSKSFAASDSTLRYAGMVIGFSFLLIAAVYLVRISFECRTCLAAAKRLAAKDLDWILSRLRVAPRHSAGAPPHKQSRLRGHKLKTLHRVFDTLDRSIRESRRVR